MQNIFKIDFTDFAFCILLCVYYANNVPKVFPGVWDAGGHVVKYLQLQQLRGVGKKGVGIIPIGCLITEL